MRVSYSFLLRWLVLLCLLPSYGLFGQTTVTIGNVSGTTTTNAMPIHYLYNYSYSQLLYTSSEINTGGWSLGGGIVNKLRFYGVTLPTAANQSKMNDWTVYLGNTSVTSLTSGAANYVPSSQMTEVYNGIVTIPASGNWVEVTFTTPFIYTGGNLIVAVLEKSSSYTNATWRTMPTTSTMGVYLYSDSYLPNPVAPSPYSGSSGSLTNAKPIVQLEMNPMPTCAGLPNAGTLSTSPSIVVAGSTFAVNTSGATVASGLSYQWQQNTGSADPL